MKIDFQNIIQIGIMTKDIRTASARFAEIFGMDNKEPSIGAPYEISGTNYKGKRCDGNFLQTTFACKNTEIEFLQPVGDEPSYWKDSMEAYGEGLNHIALKVTDMEACIKVLEEKGFECLQTGSWPGSSSPVGGKYAYIDLRKEIGLAVELLEFLE